MNEQHKQCKKFTNALFLGENIQELKIQKMAKKEPPFIHTTLVKVITNYRDFDGDFNGINFILKLL